MDCTQILKKKRNGEELNESEINYFIKNTVDGKIQDSQIGAMLMAMFVKGLTTTETVILTKSMLYSGDNLTWNPDWNDVLVDKHSTGGVGDKISIPLAPALAACGLKIPMLSGRSLEFTGGTLDKLESIPGYNVNLSKSELEKCLNDTGCFITGTTGNICPADRILYGKRNDTSTIDYINLIVASIISKKAAGGIKNLILDIKVGRGAFMKDLETAKQLGRQMVNVAGELGIKAKVYLTKMDYPLGRAVGNALEIFECVELMKGKYIPHIHELVTIFGGTLLEMVGKVNTMQEGITMVENVLKNGEAMKCFQKMLLNQGVNEKISEDLCYGDEQNLPLSFAKYKTEILAKETGWVEDIDALTIGNLCYQISSTTNNGECKPSLDLSSGAFIKKTIGEKVHENEPWLIVYHSTPNLAISDSQKNKLKNSIKITPHEFSHNAVNDLIILCIE